MQQGKTGVYSTRNTRSVMGRSGRGSRPTAIAPGLLHFDSVDRWRFCCGVPTVVLVRLAPRGGGTMLVTFGQEAIHKQRSSAKGSNSAWSSVVYGNWSGE